MGVDDLGCHDSIIRRRPSLGEQHRIDAQRCSDGIDQRRRKLSRRDPELGGVARQGERSGVGGHVLECGDHAIDQALHSLDAERIRTAHAQSEREQTGIPVRRDNVLAALRPPRARDPAG